MAATQKKIIFCLFNNKDFKPFFIDSAESGPEQVLSDFFSETFSGSTRSPCKVIKKNWKEGNEVFIHVLQEFTEAKEGAKLLNYWQEKMKSKDQHSPLGISFSEGLKKKYKTFNP